MANGGLFGKWDDSLKIIKNLNKNVEINLRKATAANGRLLRDRTKRYIRDQPTEWPALDPKTIARKGSTKMLIDKGDLLAAINFEVVDSKTFFIGWPRTEKSKDGENLANIAAVHEFGAEIEMTSSLGKNFTIVIPARASLGPTFERSKNDIQENWVLALNFAVKGKRFNVKPRK